MSSRVKHALRSHRGYSNNTAVFGRFEIKASKISDVKKLRTVDKSVPLFERIKRLFKHQSR